MQSEPLKTWKLGIITSHGIPNPKSQVPTMTWMPTWQHFLKMRPGTCVASWVVQKARPNSQPTSCEFLHKTIKIRLLYHLTIFYWFWGPCLHYWDSLTWVELGTHVNPVPWTLKFISLYLTEAATLCHSRRLAHFTELACLTQRHPDVLRCIIVSGIHLFGIGRVISRI